jgi:hypothetical protein
MLRYTFNTLLSVSKFDLLEHAIIQLDNRPEPAKHHTRYLKESLCARDILLTLNTGTFEPDELK